MPQQTSPNKNVPGGLEDNLEGFVKNPKKQKQQISLEKNMHSPSKERATQANSGNGVVTSSIHSNTQRIQFAASPDFHDTNTEDSL